ncbi:FkbM family methyltransferase [Rhodopirellula baltica]|nr:FkbM family methyltransferase [Rhodopirellula baltica]
MDLVLSGGSRCVVPVVPSSVIGHEVLLYGTYEKEVVKRFLRTLKPGDVCIDIGANFGQYSLLASRRVGPNGKVICVEPVPHVFQRLKENLERNQCENVVALNVALGESPGTLNMQVIEDENDGMHHLTHESGAGTIPVQVCTLDGLLDDLEISGDVSVIKMDVEGWEQAVLSGATRTLSPKKKPTIFFESIEEHAARFGFDALKVHQLLHKYGYRLEFLNEQHGKASIWQQFATGTTHQPNLIAVPPATRSQST